MTLVFAILAAITIAGGVAAMSLRNLVHCALALTIAFLGLAGFYLQLDAQFVGFAQILVYIGAVAILIVFAILLTRGGEGQERTIVSSSWIWGIAVTVLVFAILTVCIGLSSIPTSKQPPAPEVSIRQIGDQLMTRYILPLEVIGLLLTAALIGAVIVAMRDREAS